MALSPSGSLGRRGENRRNLRRHWAGGAFTPIPAWRRYGDHPLAPLRRSRFGSIEAVSDRWRTTGQKQRGVGSVNFGSYLGNRLGNNRREPQGQGSLSPSLSASSVFAWGRFPTEIRLLPTRASGWTAAHAARKSTRRSSSRLAGPLYWYVVRGPGLGMVTPPEARSGCPLSRGNYPRPLHAVVRQPVDPVASHVPPKPDPGRRDFHLGPRS